MSTSVESAMQFAKKFLEDLLAFFGLNVEVSVSSSEDTIIELYVPSTNMNGFLIGQRGENMRALQFLISTALKNNGYEITRVNLDIADYKKQRAERLTHKAEEWMKHVKEEGVAMDLRPMNAADRRIVHQLAAEYGIVSESRGDGRERHIVLKPGEK